MFQRISFAAISIMLLVSCQSEKVKPKVQHWTCIDVKASAYNSLAYQTSSNPFITAFGDSLQPGDKYIAVSRDLLKGSLSYNTEVIIQGMDSIWIVKDKMNSRYRNTIDIYMGYDVEKAKAWGRRKVKVCYKTALPSDTLP